MSEKITVFKNCHILTLDPTEREVSDGDIVIKGGKILRLGHGEAHHFENTADQVIDGRGKLAMPGLINGHFHSTSAFMKGAFEGAPLEVYMLYEFPLDGLAHEPRTYYLRAMLSAIEMLKQGITAVRDDVHFFGGASEAGAHAILEAYRDSGMRASVGFGIPNVVEYDKLPYLEERLSAEQKKMMQAERLPSTADITAFYEQMFASWHREHNGRMAIHTSCSAPQRVTPETLK